MDRIEDIKNINIELGDKIKLEITRIETVKREVFTFGYDEHEKRRALNEFLKVFQLHDKTKVELEV